MIRLTLRGFDPELERRLRELAVRDWLSLDKAALKLMRRGAGLESTYPSDERVGERLRRFCGSMSFFEAEQIDRAIESQRAEDMELRH